MAGVETIYRASNCGTPSEARAAVQSAKKDWKTEEVEEVMKTKLFNQQKIRLKKLRKPSCSINKSMTEEVKKKTGEDRVKKLLSISKIDDKDIPV